MPVAVATVPSVHSPTLESTKNDHNILGADAPRDRQPPVASCDGRVLGGGAVSGHSRYYKTGVREALFMLSRGRCYAPKCPQRVLRMVDDDPSINIQIAHINGLNPGSARYDESLPVEKRNSFGNLLLLCQAHHGPVDDKSKEDKYTKKMLQGWKKDREGPFYQQLAGLDVLGVEDLEAMLVFAVAETKQEILHAIDQVAPTVSANVVTTLRKLMSETFDQPYLDLDAVAMLADAASSLRHLPDSASMLTHAAGVLRNFNDSASIINSAAHRLGGLEDNVSQLHFAATSLGTALDRARSMESWDSPSSGMDAVTRELQEAATKIENAVQYIDSADYRTGIQAVNDGGHWQGFKQGFVTGGIVILAIAILIFVQIYQHKSG